MTQSIDRSNLTIDFVTLERQKSGFILNGHLLKAQGRYEESAELFAQAAEIEAQLAKSLYTNNNQAKAFVHEFSAVSCWAQAGDLHRALQLGNMLSTRQTLTQFQHQQVSQYMDRLRGRRMQWMASWASESVSAD